MKQSLAWVPSHIKEESREAFAKKAIAFKKHGAASFVFEGKTYKITTESLNEAKQYKLPVKTAQHLARLDIPGISKRNIEFLLTQVMSGKNLSPAHRATLRRLLPKLVALATEAPTSIIDKIEASLTVDVDGHDDSEIAAVAKSLNLKHTILDPVGPAGGAPVVEFRGSEENLRKLIKDKLNDEPEFYDLIEPATA